MITHITHHTGAGVMVVGKATNDLMMSMHECKRLTDVMAGMSAQNVHRLLSCEIKSFQLLFRSRRNIVMPVLLPDFAAFAVVVA